MEREKFAADSEKNIIFSRNREQKVEAEERGEMRKVEEMDDKGCGSGCTVGERGKDDGESFGRGKEEGRGDKGEKKEKER